MHPQAKRENDLSVNGLSIAKAVLELLPAHNNITFVRVQCLCALISG